MESQQKRGLYSGHQKPKQRKLVTALKKPHFIHSQTVVEVDYPIALFTVNFTYLHYNTIQRGHEAISSLILRQSDGVRLSDLGPSENQARQFRANFLPEIASQSR